MQFACAACMTVVCRKSSAVNVESLTCAVYGCQYGRNARPVHTVPKVGPKHRRTERPTVAATVLRHAMLQPLASIFLASALAVDVIPAHSGGSMQDEKCCCHMAGPRPCVCVPRCLPTCESCNKVCDSDPMFSGPCGTCDGGDQCGTAAAHEMSSVENEHDG